MCKKGGPRCASAARQRLNAAIQSRNTARIKAARDDWYLTDVGNAELAKHDPATARVYHLERERLLGTVSRDPEAGVEYLINSDTYRDLIAQRDAARQRKEDLKNVDTSTMSIEEKRAHTLASREAALHAIDVQGRLETYQSHVMDELDRIPNTTPTYTGDTLGEAVPHVRDDNNVTIGASELSSVLKTDPKYGAANRREVLAYKIDPTLRDYSDTFATQKGNRWEPQIARDFAARHPEYTQTLSDQVWSNPNDPETQAKLDVLLSTLEDGQPNAFLECKTASDPTKWHDDNGNVKVPDGYRAQVLSYLETTGFDHAYIAARIDDHTYVEARINRGEKINDKLGTIRDQQPAIDKFRAEVRAGRAAGGPTPTRTVNPHPTPEPKHNLETTIATYHNRTEEDVRASVQQRVNNGATYQEALNAELDAHPFNPEGVVIVDLETTGFTPGSGGEIIEIAYQRLDKNGNVAAEGSILTSPDHRHLRYKGTGQQDVHHITPDMVRGKPTFRDPRTQRELAQHFPDGTRIVAHNAAFENRYLETDMPNGHTYTYLDTMTLSKYFTTAPTNTLESFATHHNTPYEGAHRALADVDMTRRALTNFATTRHQAGHAAT